MTVKTRIMIWGRAAHRCSFTYCRKYFEANDGAVIRTHLDPMFRIREGALIAIATDFLSAKQYRAEYSADERQDPHPFPGLEVFKKTRKDRDVHWGEGSNVDDPECRIAGADDFLG